MMGGLRQLNLTEEQNTQVKVVMQKHQPGIKALEDQARPLRKALHDAVAADAVNPVDIKAAALALASVEADAAVLRAQIRAEVFTTVLTPDQVTKAKQLQADAKARAEQGRGMMGRGGRGRGPGRGGFLGWL